MTSPNQSRAAQILREAPLKRLSFDEFERKLRSSRALHFGVDAEDIATSLRWRGIADFERDALGNISHIWLDESRNG